MCRIKCFINLLIIICSFSTFAAFSQTNTNQLPEWLFNPENYNKLQFAVGISDPGLDKTEAMKQAKSRAILNHGLLHNASLGSLTTFAMGNEQKNTSSALTIEYILYTMIIEGKLVPESNTMVKDSFYTTQKEAMVLLEINSDKKDSLIKEFRITRRAGFQRENSSFPLFVDELDIEYLKNDSNSLKDNLYKEGAKIRKVIQAANERFLNINMKNIQLHRYTSSMDQLSSFSLPSSLNSGIWNAYIFNMIDQVCIANNFEQTKYSKLSTINTGNSTKQMQNETQQQIVYSIKNSQSKELKVNIKSFAIHNNQLLINLKSVYNQISNQIKYKKLNRSERKELKKMLKENWKVFAHDDFEMAWLLATKNPKFHSNYVSASIELRAKSLLSGIIEGIHLAKLQLSTQMAARIKSLNTQNFGPDDNTQVSTAKLINIQKMGSISPHFIFYREYGYKAYEIKVILFYNLEQITSDN